MMPFKHRVETTYADLRPDDLVIDKSGKAWPVADLDTSVPHSEQFGVTFMLCDPVSKVRMHFVRKDRTDPVTVSRVPDETENLKAEAAYLLAAIDEAENVVTLDEAVVAVEEIGGEVEVTYTEKEADAAKAATDDSPVQLPAFEDMTILEMRSHLYLLHGVYAHDMKSRVDTIAMHDQAHADHEAGKLASRHVPHVHEVK